MQNQKQLDPIQRHLKTKQFKDDRLWLVRDGRLFTYVDGYLASEDEFDEMFPVYNPLTFVHSKENIDGTTKWLRN